MEINEDINLEKEQFNKNNNVLKFLQQNKSYTEQKQKKTNNSSTNKLSQFQNIKRVKNVEKTYLDPIGDKQKHKTKLLIKLKDNKSSLEKVEDFHSTDLILPQIKTNINNNNINSNLTPRTNEKLKQIKEMNITNENVNNNKTNNINNIKSVSIPKLNLLKSTKSLNQLNILSSNLTKNIIKNKLNSTSKIIKPSEPIEKKNKNTVNHSNLNESTDIIHSNSNENIEYLEDKVKIQEKLFKINSTNNLIIHNPKEKDKSKTISNEKEISEFKKRKNFRYHNSTASANAKSLSPSKLAVPNSKIIKEFTVIKEEEENKASSPPVKSSNIFKNLSNVNCNNVTKMNLFCINKEKYYIIPGNNSELVRRCMQNRINWKECPSNAINNFNFKWQHISTGLDFGTLSKNTSIKQMVNHFEFHPAISNKINLFLNLMKYCEKKNLEVFKIIPFTVIIQYDSPSFIGQFENFENFFENIHRYTATYKSQEDNTITENIIKYGSLFKLGIHNDKLGHKTSAYIEESHFSGKNLWLVKAPDLNRGRCIKIGDSIDSIKKIVKLFNEGIFRDFKDCIDEENKISNNINENIQVLVSSHIPEKNKENKKEKKFESDFRKYRANCVILQKYIEKPLLYCGRKFDIRMWVLITNKLNVYAFKEGHLKTSSMNYDIHSGDSYVHLTNYSVQKHYKEFSKFEEGNEVSFKEFQEYADKNISVRENIYPKILELIKICAFSVKDKLNMNDRKFCFELFGFDFIVDQNFEVFVLEVNTNPGLEESSNLIKMLVPRMIDDVLRLTIDDVFDTKYSNTVDMSGDKSNLYSPFGVEGYSDLDNMW